MRRILCLALGMMLASTASAEPLVEAAKSYGSEDADVRLLVRGTTDIARFETVLQMFADRAGGARIDYEQWGSNDLFEVTTKNCLTGAGAADMVISSAVDLQIKLANDGCAKASSTCFQLARRSIRDHSRTRCHRLQQAPDRRGASAPLALRSDRPLATRTEPVSRARCHL